MHLELHGKGVKYKGKNYKVFEDHLADIDEKAWYEIEEDDMYIFAVAPDGMQLLLEEV